MLKRLLLPCLAMVAALAMGGAAAEAKSLDDIIKAGVIRVGINPNFPPMSSRGSDGNWEGFDIDVGNKIAEALGVKAEFVPTETPQRVPFLVADKIDISLGALTRTAERAKLIEFTVPLHTEVMAVLTTDKVTVGDWKELNDAKYTLADMRGNWTVDWLKQNLPNAKVSLTDTIADTVRLVGQGRADAIVENIDFFMAQTKNYPDVKWKVLPKTIDVSYDSIGVERGNYPLRDALNIVLYSLHSGGFRQRHLGEVVWRADAGEGRGEPVFLDGSETDGAGSRKGARAGFEGRDRKRNELHLPVRCRPRHPAAAAAGRHRHLRAGAAHLLGRRPHRAPGRLAQDLRRALAARSRQCLCHLLHQHAGADPDLFPLFRPAGIRHPLGQFHLRADRPHPQRRRLSDRDHAGGLHLGAAAPRWRRPRPSACRWCSRSASSSSPISPRRSIRRLANFFIVVLVMGTSVGAVVGVDELTGTAINISTENYRWIEMFIVVAGIYVVLTFIASLSLALLGRWAFRVKAKVF